MNTNKILKLNDNQFPVADNLDYYGEEASESDVDEYEEFAANFLSDLTGETIETYRVDNYGRSDPEGMRTLRQKVWDAYCRQ